MKLVAIILSPSMNSEQALSEDVIAIQTLAGSLSASGGKIAYRCHSGDVRLRTSPEPAYR